MTTCRDEVLRAERVTRFYETEKIIDQISITLRRGELVSVLGASGVGKTTLFHILSGLDQPDEGRVFLYGEDKTGVCGLVSYMQQKDLLLPFRTILDNMIVPLLLKGQTKRQAREYAAGFFVEFGLNGCEKKYPSQVSGGMRQRAAFLRAYLYNGELMLLDEPFSALDAITKTAMHTWYREMAARHGTSALFITHDIDEAISLSDRVYVIAGVPGRITCEMKIDKQGMNPSDFLTSDHFMRYKRDVLSKI